MHELHQDGKDALHHDGVCARAGPQGADPGDAGRSRPAKRSPSPSRSAKGLAEAHDLGVIHRDLKPQNIMVDNEGNAKIMDFGIARSLRGDRDDGRRDDHRDAGVHGAGAGRGPGGGPAVRISTRWESILFEMVTGRVPFEGDSPLSVAYKHKNEIPDRRPASSTPKSPSPSTS